MFAKKAVCYAETTVALGDVERGCKEVSAVPLIGKKEHKMNKKEGVSQLISARQIFSVADGNESLISPSPRIVITDD